MKKIALALLLPLAWAGMARAQEAAAPTPRIGAIPWDAWVGAQGPGNDVEASLGPEKWHTRLPYFAQVTGPDQVHLDGSSQEDIDQEIDWAAHAGLAYWGFVYYLEDSPMSLALKRYLSSAHRDKIGFCMVGGANSLFEPAQARRLLALFAEPGYVKVGPHRDRPLIYIGFLSDKQLHDHGLTTDKFAGIIADFRKQSVDRGLGDPYLVIMDFTPAKGKTWADALGAQAITSYDASGPGKGETYRQLAQYAETFWETCRATGAAVVPIGMSGHDRRPRVEHPVHWEKTQKPGVGIEKYYEQPTPDELAAHVGRLLEWLAAHRDAAPEQIGLIYAWNEIDEGGWLLPTLAEGTARVDALHGVLAPNTP